jgi:hypothetical protein
VTGHVFISYGRGSDDGYVSSLAAFLADAGVSAWFDQSIESGQPWQRVLQEQLDTCAGVVVVMTPAAEASKWVQREIQWAEAQAKPILPLLRSGKAVFGLHDIQYEDVQTGAMPSATFVARLRNLVTGSGSGRMATGSLGLVGGARRSLVAGKVPHTVAGLLARQYLLDRLVTAGQAGQASVVSAVSGARGVGKTQLAAQYARRAVAHGWPVVVWLDAETEDQVVAGLAALAAAAGLPEVPSTPAAADSALDWLSMQHGPCLLVYDNAVDPDLIARWTPSLGNVRIVVTTVRAAFAALAEPIEVDTFTDDEARTYLRERTGLDDDPAATDLAAELDNLPLALAQAAALIGPSRGRTYHTYAAYLAALGTAPIDQHLPPVLGSQYRHGMAQALRLSIDHLTAADPRGHAVSLLNMLAVLAPTGIATALLTTPPGIVRPDHPHLDPAGIRTAVAMLTDRALAVESIDATTITTHRLTQRIIRENLTTTGRLDQTRAEAATFVEALIPADTKSRDVWPRCALLLPHALAVANPLGLPMWRLALYLIAAGEYRTAVSVWTTITDRYQFALGPEHPGTLASLDNLARSYGQAGDPTRARDALAALLPVRERVLGAEHPDTLNARANLAYWTGQAGDSIGARDLYETLLPVREQVLGAEHPDTLTARAYLAVWTGMAGDPVRARDLLAILLPIRERVSGAEHPDTLIARAYLAYWTGHAGDPIGARDLYATLLPVRERVLGGEHPDTLTTRANLARFTGQAGDPTRARDLLAALLPIRERVSGAEHPDTHTARDSLGHWTRRAEETPNSR